MYLRCDRTFIEHPSLIVEALVVQGIEARVETPTAIAGVASGHAFWIFIHPHLFVAVLSVCDSRRLPIDELSEETKVLYRSSIANPDFNSSSRGKRSSALLERLLTDSLIAEELLRAARQMEWDIIDDPAEAEIAYVESRFPATPRSQEIIAAIRSERAAIIADIESRDFARAAEQRSQLDRLLNDLYFEHVF